MIPATELLGLVVVLAAIVACMRRIDVRLVLFLAAVVLGCLARRPDAIVRKFLETFADERYVVPICTAMGFAHVLRLSGCDIHLVRLLTVPIRKARVILIPGAIVVGFLVNMPVVSQTSTAVTIGAVLIPLLLAARLSPATAGAILLLGSSVGGELLNPGATEINTIADYTGRERIDLVRLILPLDLVQLTVSTLVFWILNRRTFLDEPPAASPDPSSQTKEDDDRPNLLKALVPLIPLVLLIVIGKPEDGFKPVGIPVEWLTSNVKSFDARLVGAAMLIGALVAAFVTPSRAKEAARSFFEGAGYAFTHIISLIIVANCFGEGVKLVGLSEWIGNLAGQAPQLLVPAAGLFPLSFAALSGSGIASTQSLYKFFADAAVSLNLDPARLGAVVALGSAAGRTMSPFAAVALMCGTLTATEPLVLVKRVMLPLFAGVAAMIALAMILV